MLRGLGLTLHRETVTLKMNRLSSQLLMFRLEASHIDKEVLIMGGQLMDKSKAHSKFMNLRYL
jgi:hypothetical protein